MKPCAAAGGPSTEQPHRTCPLEGEAERGGSAALCQGTPRPWRPSQLFLDKGKALLAAQSNNVGLVLAARGTLPEARLTKHNSRGTPVSALLRCLQHCLQHCSLRVPPGRRKQWGYSMCVLSTPAQGQWALLKPHGETLVLCPSEEEKAQPGAACCSRDHLGAPQHTKGLIQAGLQHQSEARRVLQQLFLIRNYHFFLIRS